MEPIYIQLGLGIFSAVLGGVVSWIGWKLQKAEKARETLEQQRKIEQWEAEERLRKDMDLLKSGTLSMLHNRLVSIMMECHEQQCKHIYQVENVEHMYKAYRGLGGNGTVKQMYKEFAELPIVPGGVNNAQNND